MQPLRKIKNNQSRNYQVLDPCFLGRPIHLLEKFSASIAISLNVFFSTKLNRRSGPSFKVKKAVFLPTTPDSIQGGLLHLSENMGDASVVIDRFIVLSILESRYGHAKKRDELLIKDSVDAPPQNDEQSQIDNESDTLADISHRDVSTRLANLAPTATETRQRENLEKNLLKTLINALTKEKISDSSVYIPSGFHPTFTIECDIEEEYSGHSSTITFVLGQRWQQILLDQLTVHISQGRRKMDERPLTKKLDIKLTAKLFDISISLSKLLSLKAGDVLPINMRTHAHVYAGYSALFSAAVVEKNGQLCLTSFTTLE
ncbi:FliM/FliN family flagellar motor switch protein [Chromobacterium amazonense]|uniref:FliM/FliN family flagellar motor switch protein n=1 Tax=Chromobacterium amazonense TaxID=1382803 RepID=UPI0031F6A03E